MYRPLFADNTAPPLLTVRALAPYRAVPDINIAEKDLLHVFHQGEATWLCEHKGRIIRITKPSLNGAPVVSAPVAVPTSSSASSSLPSSSPLTIPPGGDESVRDSKGRRLSLRIKKPLQSFSSHSRAVLAMQQSPEAPPEVVEHLLAETITSGFDPNYAEVCTTLSHTHTPAHTCTYTSGPRGNREGDTLAVAPVEYDETNNSSPHTQLFEPDERFRTLFGCSKQEYLNFSGPKRVAMRKEAGFA